METNRKAVSLLFACCTVFNYSSYAQGTMHVLSGNNVHTTCESAIGGERITTELVLSVFTNRFKEKKGDAIAKFSTLYWPDTNSFIAFNPDNSPLNTGRQEEDIERGGCNAFGREAVFTKLIENSYGYKAIDSLSIESFYFSDYLARLIAYYTKLADPDIETRDDIDELKQAADERLNLLKSSGRDKNASPDFNKAIISLVNDYNAFLKMLSEAYQEDLRKTAIVKQKLHEEAVNALVNKHSKSGLSRAVLLAQIRTYEGGTESGGLGAFVELLDKLKGSTRLKIAGDKILLHQSMMDDLTDKKHRLDFEFYDVVKKDGYIWLERLMVDGEEFTQSGLATYIAIILTSD